MKRNVFGLVASLALAGTMVAAQDSQVPSPAPQPQPSQSVPRPQPQPAPSSMSQPADKADETTLTGCLVQGSGPAVFILENAKLGTDARDAKGKSYVIDLGGASADLKSEVNHQVRIVGVAEAKAAAMPAPGQQVSEQELPKLTAKAITRVADTCPTTSAD